MKGTSKTTQLKATRGGNVFKVGSKSQHSLINKGPAAMVIVGVGSKIPEEKCLICKKTISKEIPRASRKPKDVTTLDEIWPYLAPFRKITDGDNNGDDDEMELSRIFGVQKSQFIKIFVRMPCICQPCWDKVEALSDLLTSLRSNLKELRKIIVESMEHDNKRSSDSVPLKSYSRKEVKKEMKEDAAQSRSLDKRKTCEDTIYNEQPTVSPPISRKKARHGSELIVVASSSRELDYITEASSDEDDDSGDFGRDPLCSEDEASDTTDEDNMGGTKSSACTDEENKVTDSPKVVKIETSANKTLIPLTKENKDEEIPDNTIIIPATKEKKDEKSQAKEGVKSGIKPSACAVEENKLNDPSKVVKIEKSPDNTIIPEEQPKILPYTTYPRLPNELTEFPCPLEECGRVLPNRTMLKTHVSQEHKGTERFICTCGLYFLSTKSRSDHRRTSSVHAEERKKLLILPLPKNFMPGCDLCGTKLYPSNALEHVQGHVGDYALKCLNEACFHVYGTHAAFHLHGRGSSKCKAAYRNDKEFSCDTCGFKTDAITNLRVHLEGFHEREPKKTLKCPLPSCDKWFCVRQSVTFHLNTHLYRDTSFQKCDQCDKKIKTVEMEEHLKGEHDAKEIINCQQCPFIFSSRFSLVQHLFEHRHNGMYCDICNDNVKYIRHHELRSHYKSAHNVAGEEYVCEHCNKEYSMKTSWMAHVKYQHSEKEKKPPTKKKIFSCDLCFETKDFLTEDSFISHKIKVHGEEPFKCSQCEATFTVRHHLTRHEKEHDGIQIQKEFICEVSGCGRVFGRKSKLDQHVAVVHLGERKFVCDLCEKGYGSKKGLRHHHEIVHLGLRPCVCDMCGEGFVSGTVLKRHKLIHTGERPFACELCGQRFRQEGVLKRHLESHEKKGEDFKPNGPMKQIRKRKAQ